MNIQKIMTAFRDLYLKVNFENNLIEEVYPNIKRFKFPLSYEEFVDKFFFRMSEQPKSKMLCYLNSKPVGKTINIKASGVWISLEVLSIDESVYVHIFSTDNSLKILENTMTLTQLDPLTNLLHKNAIASYINQQIESGTVASAALFMVDIDHFKEVNDNYGHMFGDKVIIEVAKILRKIPNSMVGRIGGDEFIIYIEGEFKRENLKDIARKIRYLFDNARINSLHFPMSSTIGIAEYPKNGLTFEALFDCCDKALYRGKQKGRDCHVIFDPMLHSTINSELPESNYTHNNAISIIEFVDIIVNKIKKSKSLEERHNIFSDIGNYFDVDRIITYRAGKMTVLHCREGISEKTIDLKDFDFEKYKKNFIDDNVFSVNDTNTLKSRNSEVYKVIKKTNILSFVQILLTNDKDEIDGFISYENLNNKKRVWQTAEINYIVILTKILKFI